MATHSSRDWKIPWTEPDRLAYVDCKELNISGQLSLRAQEIKVLPMRRVYILTEKRHKPIGEGGGGAALTAFEKRNQMAYKKPVKGKETCPACWFTKHLKVWSPGLVTVWEEIMLIAVDFLESNLTVALKASLVNMEPAPPLGPPAWVSMCRSSCRRQGRPGLRDSCP